MKIGFGVFAPCEKAVHIMSIVLDIVLVVIAAVCIISGYRRGFFKTVMGLVSGIASLLAAYSFSPALSAWIYEKFMLNSHRCGCSGGGFLRKLTF